LHSAADFYDELVQIKSDLKFVRWEMHIIRQILSYQVRLLTEDEFSSTSR
jgi:hypothetical protein